MPVDHPLADQSAEPHLYEIYDVESRPIARLTRAEMDIYSRGRWPDWFLGYLCDKYPAVKAAIEAAGFPVAD